MQVVLAVIAVIQGIALAYFFLHLKKKKAAPPDLEGLPGSGTSAGSVFSHSDCEQLFKLSLDMLAVSDADGRFVVLSPAWRRALGYTPEQMLRRTLSELVDEEDLPAAAALAGRLESGEAIEAELRVRHAEGGLRWLLVAVRADRAAGRVFTVAKDITELKEAGARMEESARDLALKNEQLAHSAELAREAASVKTRFLATLSHEIRTPMNGILGMTELLLTTPMMPDQREFATTVRTSAQSLLHMLNEILDLSKIEAGKLRLEEIPFRLGDVIDGVVSLHYPEAKTKRLALQCYSSDDLPACVRGDPTRLRQVLVNLVGNAVKFTERGSVILRICVAEQDGPRATVLFEVMDSGIGIDAGHLPFLFESFTQADSSTTRRFGGTGLGLAISKQLVEAMGGEIGCSSQVGKGSLFWFTIPLLVEGQAEDEGQAVRGQGVSTAHALTAPEARLRYGGGAPALPAAPVLPWQERRDAWPPVPRPRALLVDDNTISLRVALRLLERLGVDAQAAGDGRQAVDAICRGGFDIVFMDLEMPVMDGFAATREIRRHARSRIPIVAMTASAMEGDRERSAAAGMDDYITKPVSLQQLQCVLGRWLAPFMAAEAGAPPTLDSSGASLSRPPAGDPPG